MKLYLIYFLIINVLLSINVMAEKPYHHLADGTFRNPEGSPKRDPNIKWSYKVFNEERKKIKINFPKDHVVPRNKVLKDLNENSNNDYIAWIHHFCQDLATLNVLTTLFYL